MYPTLTTKRLILVPYPASMATDRHVAWLNDPEIVKYSERRHYKHTLATQHIYFNAFPAGSHIWLIRTIIDIGTITAYRDRPNQTANMGIMLGYKDTFRRGYGTEAWAKVMEFLFDDGVRKIECGFMDSNRAMRGICRKTGMRGICRKTGMNYEATVPGHFILDGKPEDMVLFGVSMVLFGVSK